MHFCRHLPCDSTHVVPLKVLRLTTLNFYKHCPLQSSLLGLSNVCPATAELFKSIPQTAWCECQHVQPTVLLESWWYHPSNAILGYATYATRKKSHGTKWGQLGRCGITVILFLVRNLGTDSTVNRCKSQIMQQSDTVQIVSQYGLNWPRLASS